MFQVSSRAQAAFVYYDRLRRVKDFVEHNYSDDVDLRRAAQVAGLEMKYFSTFFHRRTGMCFRDWLAGLRVARAKKMIEVRDFSITEIAHSVGFQDLRTFERAFKRRVGMTPRAFKNRVRPS